MSWHNVFASALLPAWSTAELSLERLPPLSSNGISLLLLPFLRDSSSSLHRCPLSHQLTCLFLMSTFLWDKCWQWGWGCCDRCWAAVTSKVRNLACPVSACAIPHGFSISSCIPSLSPSSDVNISPHSFHIPTARLANAEVLLGSLVYGSHHRSVWWILGRSKAEHRLQSSIQTN